MCSKVTSNGRENPAFVYDATSGEAEELSSPSVTARALGQGAIREVIRDRLSSFGDGRSRNEPSTKAPEAPEGTYTSQKDPVELKKRVGLTSAVAMVVGCMIGSGIFVSPKGVLQRTESVGLSLLIWMACGVLSLLASLVYAELGTVVTTSGGEHAYFLKAFGSNNKGSNSWLRPIPAFLFIWVTVVLLKPTSFAIICMVCSEYLLNLLPLGCNEKNAPHPVAVKLVAISVIALIAFINSYSVRAATKVQNLFTAAKLGAIAVIILCGISRLAAGHTQHLAAGFQGSSRSPGNIAAAFYSGLWAYGGWRNLNFITEEVKNPSKNLPRALIIGVVLVTACYLMTNISYFTVLTKEELLAAETVAVTFGNKVLGVAALLMPLAVVISTFGAANGGAFTASRLCFAAAREGHLISLLSFVHVHRLTPSPALLFHAGMAILMVIPSSVGSLIEFLGFTAWIFYGGSMVALLVLRRTMKNTPRPYKVPIVIPWLVLLAAVYLVIGPIVDSPQVESLYALLFILAGLFLYFPFVYYKASCPGMGYLTSITQILLEVVPPDVAPAQ